MSKVKKSTANNAESVLLNVERISNTVSRDDIQVLVGAIDQEIGNRKLEKEEIEQLQAIMSVDALEAMNWKNTADVLKYISIFSLAESNPEVTKKITEVLLGIIGIFYPIANTAQGILAKVPNRLFSALIQVGGFASPDYLIYRGVRIIASKKSEKAKTQAEIDAYASQDMVNLIIVCKNKLLSAEMDKLINLKDDIDDEAIVGTKDGTVHTIIWNESAWETFRDRLTGSDKVLIIGKVKNTMPLTSEQIRFQEFGVKYGWNHNIAMIEADPKVLKKAKVYDDFLAAINSLQISEDLKKNAKVKMDWTTAGKLAIFPPLLIGDVLHEDIAVRKQQLLYGLHTLYMQDLSKFLDPQESL